MRNGAGFREISPPRPKTPSGAWHSGTSLRSISALIINALIIEIGFDNALIINTLITDTLITLIATIEDFDRIIAIARFMFLGTALIIVFFWLVSKISIRCLAFTSYLIIIHLLYLKSFLTYRIRYSIILFLNYSIFRLRLRINYFISSFLSRIINSEDEDRRLYKSKIRSIIDFSYVIEITL